MALPVELEINHNFDFAEAFPSRSPETNGWTDIWTDGRTDWHKLQKQPGPGGFLLVRYSLPSFKSIHRSKCL